MTLIAAAPNTPAEPTVEAINAIMDIYADADFDYDGPVFVNCGFLAHLQKALPNVRTIVSNHLILCFILICRISSHPLFSRFWFHFNFCYMWDFPEYLAAGP